MLLECSNKKVHLKELFMTCALDVINDLLGENFDLLPIFKDYKNSKQKAKINKIIMSLEEKAEDICGDINEFFLDLSAFEKIYAMHSVLEYLFSENEVKSLDLWMEATIDVFFSMMESCVSVELDIPKDEDEEYRFRTRKLIKNALKENTEFKRINEKNKNINYWLEKIDLLKNVILGESDFELGLYNVNLPFTKVSKEEMINMISKIFEMSY